MTTLLYHLVFLFWKLGGLLGFHRRPKLARVEDFSGLDGFRKEF